jgi:hypothetical protein
LWVFIATTSTSNTVLAYKVISYGAGAGILQPFYHLSHQLLIYFYIYLPFISWDYLPFVNYFLEKKACKEVMAPWE